MAEPEPEQPRWQGIVTDVWADGDTFTARFSRVDIEFQSELMAEFSMKQCGLTNIVKGDLVEITPGCVTRIDLPPWTKHEIEQIKRRAREHRKRLMKHLSWEERLMWSWLNRIPGWLELMQMIAKKRGHW